MPLLETLVSYFGHKIADELYQKLRSDVVRILADGAQDIGPTLTRIEEALEDRYLLSLRDGIDDLRIHRYESARRNFMAARPPRLDAPVPMYLLGCCLIRLAQLESNSDDATLLLKDGQDWVERAIK